MSDDELPRLKAYTGPWIPEGFVTLESVKRRWRIDSDQARMDRLRKALRSGVIGARLLTSDWGPIPIRKEAWAGEEARQVLERGTASVGFSGRVYGRRWPRQAPLDLRKLGEPRSPNVVILRRGDVNRLFPAPSVDASKMKPAPRKSARGKKRGPWFSHLPSFLAQRLEADAAYFESSQKTIHAEVRRHFDQRDPKGKRWGQVPTSRSALEAAIKAAEPRISTIQNGRVARLPGG